mmetsp:Transcript_26331/g.75573  ORF Transcript_26331/g.75573 Transcript_26331/m.75573 type:complete len:107 (+) Transcript_26331:839-1159(+)
MRSMCRSAIANSWRCITALCLGMSFGMHGLAISHGLQMQLQAQLVKTWGCFAQCQASTIGGMQWAVGPLFQVPHVRLHLPGFLSMMLETLVIAGWLRSFSCRPTDR